MNLALFQLMEAAIIIGMRTIGNILWLFLSGIAFALEYTIAGILNCITIVGIPFGIASFRLARFALWPFGRDIVPKPSSGVVSTVGNIIWIVLGGIWISLSHWIAGVLWCITIIGIPFGKIHFKMARLALTPLGVEIVHAR